MGFTPKRRSKVNFMGNIETPGEQACRKALRKHEPSSQESQEGAPAHCDEREWAPSQVRPRDYQEIKKCAKGPASTLANANQKQRKIREYTLGEEIANSISHGSGALFAIAAIPILVRRSLGGEGIVLFAVLVYGITMLLEYTMSTLYHAIAVEKAKKVFKILDHSCIYMFIAGTYTPFCLVSLQNEGGVYLFAAVWALALLGIAFEAFWVFRPRWISAVLYLLLGWCIAWYLPPLIQVLPVGGLYLLVAGGLCYTVGCIFYVLKKIPYMHSIFHVWVLAGSVCHFLAILLYVV